MESVEWYNMMRYFLVQFWSSMVLKFCRYEENMSSYKYTRNTGYAHMVVFCLNLQRFDSFFLCSVQQHLPIEGLLDSRLGAALS